MIQDSRFSFYSEPGAKITASMLKRAGIYPNVNGYNYILHAVDQLIKYGKTDLKKLFEVIGKTFNVKAKSIASSINYLTRVFCSNGEYEIGKQMYFFPNRQLTSKEMIYLIYDDVKENLKSHSN